MTTRHRARPRPGVSVEAVIADPAAGTEELLSAAMSPALNEDLSLGLLKRRDLSSQVLEELGRNGQAMKSRKVRIAVIAHARTPRHVSIPAMRHLFTFELMELALLPQVPADVKRVAEDSLVLRMETISPGERLTLAKRGSVGVCSALLNDVEERIVKAALDNPRLTEEHLVKALLREDKDPAPILPHNICKHGKWPLRLEVKAALLRNPYTSFSYAIQCSQSFSLAVLRQIMEKSLLPEKIKAYLLQTSERRC